MWGSAFSDLAKKAQDLQEQAKEQASHIATPTFFNLDAMQDDNADEASNELFMTPHPSNHARSSGNNVTDGKVAVADDTKQSAQVRNDGVLMPMSLEKTIQSASVVVDKKSAVGDVTAKSHSSGMDRHAYFPSTQQQRSDDFFGEHTAHASLAAVPDVSSLNVAPPADSAEATGWDSDAFDSHEFQQLEPRHNDVKKEKAAPVSAQGISTLNIVSSADSAQEEASGWEDDDGLLALESDDVEESTSVEPVYQDAGKQSMDVNQQAVPETDDAVSKSRGQEMETVDDMNHETMAEKEIIGDSTAVVGAVSLNGGDGHDAATKSPEADFPQLEVPEEQEQVMQEPVMDSKSFIDDKDELVSAETDNATEALEPPMEEPGTQVVSETSVKESIVVDGPNEGWEEQDDDVMEVSPVTDASSLNGGDQHEEIAQSPVNESESQGLYEKAVVEEVAVPETTDVDDFHFESQTDNNDEHDDVAASNEHEIGPSESDSVDAKDDAAVQEYKEEITAQDGTNVHHVVEAEAAKYNDEPIPQGISPNTATLGGSSRATGTMEPSQVSTDDFSLELEKEIERLTERHEKHLQETIDSFNHDHCESERRDMEQRFMDQIRGKEEHLQELTRENEGYQLKIDALKREVTGTQALLEQRDSAMGNVNASHSKNVELLEEKIKDMNDAASLAKSEADKVKEELQSTKIELDTSNEAYATLKARVKVVATELKERRVECRSLAATVTDLKRTNDQLETQMVNLQSQILDRERRQTEKDVEVKHLREKIETLEVELHKTSSALKDRDAVGEKALTAYKKKAQNALAVANARAAAANQAKEEAELEAATARTMSEDAVQRARVAETAGNKALSEAEDYVRDMVTEKEALEQRLSEATEALETTSAESEHLRNAFDASRAAQEKLVEDVKLITHDREEERSRNRNLQQQLDENQRRLELLYEEVETLREELRQAATVAASSSGDNTEKESRPIWTHPSRTSDEIPDRLDAEGTIAMLEGELRDANRAIKELKDALKNAILEQGSNGYGHNVEATSSAAKHHVASRAAPSSRPAGNESTPLFYAMEKQAELNTARDEINRLANLLGDAESSKMEAYDAMEEMRRRMEETEARLNRQEKFEGTTKPTASATHDADGNANLEYLKNIMLSYLNAKTLAEKKALVPVIAAVLCLTPEEQAAAVKNLDESGGIESVGKALFESFGGSMRR